MIATRYLNSASHTAWPSVETLANDLGTDRRSVQRALSQLVEAGFLDRQLNQGRRARGGWSNLYKIAALSDLRGGQVAAPSEPKGRAFRTRRGGQVAAQTLERTLKSFFGASFGISYVAVTAAASGEFVSIWLAVYSQGMRGRDSHGRLDARAGEY